MASVSAVPSRPLERRRSVLPRVLLGLVVVVMVVVAGLASWMYSLANAALPQLDGSIAVKGLSAPVTVIRDSHGVPHLAASNLKDLFLAQGYVTAQDRLWQMDATRRFAGGEMAEVFGPEMLEHDRTQRILGLRQAAERGVSELSDQEREYLEAYAAGVNAFIENHRDSLPMEFRLPGRKYAPRPWAVADSLIIGAHMSQLLNFDMVEEKLNREKVTKKVGPELAADLYVNSSWEERAPTDPRPDLKEMPASEEDDEDGPDDPVEMRSTKAQAPWSVRKAQLLSLVSGGAKDWTGDPRPRPGSNNWVVSGEHTLTGRPLLSNDMHLPMSIPSIWYEAHLTAGAFDVVGFTLPGIPAVIVGHNQRIAWGFTNVGPDVTDLYEETINTQGEYETPAGWQKAGQRREVIHVLGQPDVVVNVMTTRHGPIVSELFPGETRKLALRWVLYEKGGLTEPFFQIDAAGNFEEFRKATSQFAGPGQNIVYADVDGHIGYQATGFVPVRASGDGLLPAPGKDDAHEWTGYIPFEAMPHVLDPEDGIIATANGRITPKKYPYLVANEWEAPFRTARIYHVLESGKKFGADDMLGLQLDVQSEFDRFCADHFVYALDHAKKVSGRAKQSAELLRNWDGRVMPDAAAPTITVLARRRLARMLLEPKLGSEYKLYQWAMSPVWLENVMLHQPARWLPSTYANYDELLAAAVEAVVGEPGAPKDLASWRWGKAFPLELNHPVFGKIPLLENWAGPGKLPHQGNGYTVDAIGASYGPSERMTVDLSNLDASNFNIVTGESGEIFSPHYLDHWKAWYTGTTFTMPFSAAAVEKNQKHRLVLTPRKP